MCSVHADHGIRYMYAIWVETVYIHGMVLNLHYILQYWKQCVETLLTFQFGLFFYATDAQNVNTEIGKIVYTEVKPKSPTKIC